MPSITTSKYCGRPKVVENRNAAPAFVKLRTVHSSFGAFSLRTIKPPLSFARGRTRVFQLSRFRSSREIIGGRLLLRELRIAIGQALQFGSLLGRAFSDGAH